MRLIFLILCPILCAAVLASCSGLTREGRIEAQLEKHGVKPKLAHCMAHKLDDKLSDSELSELRDAMKRPGDPQVSSSEKIALGIAGIDDPHVAEVVTRAALGCAILG